MSNFFRSTYSKTIGIIAVVAIVIGIPLVILNVKSQQTLQQNAAFPSVTVIPAWQTSQSAIATCPGPTVVIHVTFKNTESGGSSNAMKVTAKDQQSGKTVDLGIIQPGQSKSGDITIGKSSVTKGTVTFFISWANGRSGADTETASYNAITCHTPTNTPTPSPKPSNTPTPTYTVTPTRIPSVTPTNTPVPSATNTPTPTVCTAPGVVTNVRVSCSINCTNQ